MQVPFRYEEGGEVKLELVKVRVCASCSEKLFHHQVKEMQRREGESAAAATVEASRGTGGSQPSSKPSSKRSNKHRDADTDADADTDTDTDADADTDAGSSGDNGRDRSSGKKRKVEVSASL